MTLEGCYKSQNLLPAWRIKWLTLLKKTLLNQWLFPVNLLPKIHPIKKEVTVLVFREQSSVLHFSHVCLFRVIAEVWPRVRSGSHSGRCGSVVHHWNIGRHIGIQQGWLGVLGWKSAHKSTRHDDAAWAKLKKIASSCHVLLRGCLNPRPPNQPFWMTMRLLRSNSQQHWHTRNRDLQSGFVVALQRDQKHDLFSRSGLQY